MTKLDACYARYGTLQADPAGGLLWRKAPDWVKPFSVPDQIVLRNIYNKPVYRIFANTDIHAPLAAAFSALIICGAHLELSTFDGCFNVRWVRGYPGIPSFHSWAIAIDFNAKENPLGKDGKWSPRFVDCFRQAGFTWGGDFKSRPDPQHFELRDIPVSS